MNKKTLVLFGIIFINFLYSQTNWELLNPKPTANTGKDIDFVSNSTGYIITSNELLETVDSGVSWTKKQNISSGNDMSFHNTQGYIVGNNGYVLKTINGGITWNQISTGFNDSFNTVNIIDNNNIIISGSNSLVTTHDGGQTWQWTPIPNVTVVKTAFTSLLVGHAVCYGKIIKTIDGGLNWYTTYSTNTIPANFFTVYFVNENVGFATKQHHEMYKTTNGGETWVEISSVTEAVFDFHFLDINNGYATGEYGATYKTNNGGATWSQIFFQNGYFDNTSMYGIYFQNNNIGYATGARGRIIKTVDGGTTWTHLSPTYDHFRQIQFLNSNTGYAQTGNRFYKTINGGNTWTFVGSLNLGISAVSSNFTFVNENLGYATTGGTYGGHVYKTIDGGITWTILNNGNDIIDEGITAIFFLNDNIGFISGGFNQRKVMKTTNGGTTWQQISNQTFGDIQFVNQSVGYANRIGNYNGAIYKTIDGGNTWSINFELSGKSISSIHFIDANTGYFIGDNSLFYTTTNGGITWQPISIPYGYFKLVKFYSASTGYIVDDYGKIYKTVNAGSNWSLLTTQYGINSITLNGNYIYTAGDNGRIYRGEMGVLNTSDNSFLDEDISIFPNPTSDYINIKANNNKKINNIELYTIEGKLIRPVSASNLSSIIKINVSDLQKGIYFLKMIFKNNKILTKKIILK